MLKEARARYEKGRLVMADGSETPPDGAEVIVIYQAPSSAPADLDELYGSWAGKFGPGFDIEKELRAIRSGWKRRLGDDRG